MLLKKSDIYEATKQYNGRESALTESATKVGSAFS